MNEKRMLQSPPENITQIYDNATLFMDTSLNVQQMMAVSSTDINRMIEGVSQMAAKSSKSAKDIKDVVEKFNHDAQ